MNTSNETLRNSFPEKLSQLKIDIKSKKDYIINSITILKEDIDELDRLISDFQKLLNSVIDDSVTGLKGNCKIDGQLKYSFLIKSFFCQRLHFVSKLTIYSRLQSLYCIFRPVFRQ